MGSSLSPVLQAFFAGQQGQTSLIKQAQEISNQSQERANQAEERKQRQQSLDDIMKRFDISSKQEATRIANETQRVQLEHDLHLMNAKEALRSGLQNESIPPQQSMQPSGMMIPGMPQLEPPSVPQGQVAIPGVLPQPPSGAQAQRFQSATPDLLIPGGGLPTLQTNQIQTQDTPLGSISVAMPKLKSTLDQAAEQAKADISRSSAETLFKNTKEPEMQRQLDFKQQQLEALNQRSQEKLDNLTLLHNLTGTMKEELAAAKAQHETDKRYGFRSPEQYKADVANSGMAVATGQLQYVQIPDQQEKRDVKEWLDSHHYSIPGKDIGEKVMSHAADAAQATVLLQKMKELMKSNSSGGGHAANILRNMIPDAFAGLSDVKSQFLGVQNDLIAPLERARGLSLARAGSSPGIQKIQKFTPPSLTDKPESMNYKAAETLDIHMSAAQNEMASLSPEHRKLFYQKFVDEYPALLHDPVIGPKLFKAATTGTYVAGVK